MSFIICFFVLVLFLLRKIAVRLRPLRVWQSLMLCLLPLSSPSSPLPLTPVGLPILGTGFEIVTWKNQAWIFQMFSPRQYMKKQRHHFADKGPYSCSYSFSSSHVWMDHTWKSIFPVQLDHKEGWALKSWCFKTVVLEKTLECLLSCKEIKPVVPKGNQFWILLGRTDAEAAAAILWPPDEKNWLIRKDPDAGKDERGEVDKRGRDGWVASLTWWTWVWANYGR